MNAIVCPDCLTVRGVVSVVSVGEPCRRCHKAPAVRLTPKEIRTCIRAAPGYRTAFARDEREFPESSPPASETAAPSCTRSTSS